MRLLNDNDPLYDAQPDNDDPYDNPHYDSRLENEPLSYYLQELQKKGLTGSFTE